MTTSSFNVTKKVNEEFSVRLPNEFDENLPPADTLYAYPRMSFATAIATGSPTMGLRPSSAFVIPAPIMVGGTPTLTTTGSSGSVTVSSTGSIYSSAGTLNLVPDYFILGNNYGNPYTIWIPFKVSVGVITVVSATLKLVCSTVRSTEITSKIGFDRNTFEASLNTPSDSGDLDGRASTISNTITKSGLSEGTIYEYDVTAAVQEIVNLAGWASGNYMAALIKDKSPYNENSYFSSYANDGGYAKPILYITY